RSQTPNADTDVAIDRKGFVASDGPEQATDRFAQALRITLTDLVVIERVPGSSTEVVQVRSRDVCFGDALGRTDDVPEWRGGLVMTDCEPPPSGSEAALERRVPVFLSWLKT